MTRHSFFVLLLLTVFALADDRLAAQHAPGAAEAQPKAQTAQTPPEKTQRSTEEAPKAQTAQGGMVDTQVRTEKAQSPAEAAQAKQEAAPGLSEDAQAHPEKTQGSAEEPQAKTEGDAKLISVPGGKALGMSILGNQEAPTSLVIVPWKTSELGRTPGISPMLDDSRQPVDKEVFLRALRYYEIRSATKP